MRQRIALHEPVPTADEAGGASVVWTLRGTVWAEFRYRRGGESLDGGGLRGQASFKVRLRATPLTVLITGDWRFADVQTGAVYNVREVDAVSDPAHVWLVGESGVAV